MHDLKMTDKDNWGLENNGLEVTVLRSKRQYVALQFCVLLKAAT